MNWKDENGFKELFSSYYNVLCNYASQIVRDDHKSEDIVHEVFLKLWAKKSSLNIKTESLKSYLFKATRNMAFEHIRTSQTKAKYEELYARFNSNKEEDRSLLEDKFLIKEAIKRSVRQLPPKCQEVYLLRTQNGLTFGEIANELNISPRTVENHMATAIKKLRELIKKQLKHYR